MVLNTGRAVRMLRVSWRLLCPFCFLLCLNILVFKHRREERDTPEMQTWRNLSVEEISRMSVMGRRMFLDVPVPVHSREERDRPEIQTWRNLSVEEISRMSVMGRRMFLEEDVGTIQGDKTFTILIWKFGKGMEKRFLNEYGSVRKAPFRNCSAQNCRITYDLKEMATADAVMFHMHVVRGPHTIPNRTRQDQRWIWMTDESPRNTFMVAKEKRIETYNGFFNWSMSYRMDTDVPVPYGRTLTLTAEEAAAYQPVDFFDQKPKLAAIMGSNCGGGNRWGIAREIGKHMPLDMYGYCGDAEHKKMCPGHSKKDCPYLSQYKFYLAFENSNCDGYISEKVWWNSFEKGAVPVVMGATKEEYRSTLPPDSFIHVDDFRTPKNLAQYLMRLGNNKEEYMKFHAWRAKYRIANEHGYFQTPVYHYCRICEALNYNSPRPKVYNDLKAYWGKDAHCRPYKWMKEELKAFAREDVQWFPKGFFWFMF